MKIKDTASKERFLKGRKKAEVRNENHNAILEGINRILREALVCSTEQELGRICLSVAEEVTGSQFGLFGEIKQDMFEDVSISDAGWVACRMGNPTGHRKLTTGLKVRGLYGRVLLDGKGFFVNNPATHPDWTGLPEGHPPLEAFLGIPLIHEGKIIGMVGLGNRQGGYTQEHLHAMEMIAPAMVQALLHNRAEQALRESEEKVRSQLNEIEAIYKSAHVGMCVFDRNLRFVRINDRLSEINGVPAEDHIGKTVREVVPDLADLAGKIADRVFLTGEPVLNVEFSGTTPSYPGIERYWVEQWLPLKDPSGEVIGINVVVEEVTDRKRAHAELEMRVRERTAELQRKNIELQEFAFVASHDLSEPLRKIQTFGSLLSAKCGDLLDDQSRDYISRMTVAANRMQELLEALLRYSRIETRGQDFRPMRLNEAVQDAAGDLDVPIHKIGAHLEVGPLPIIRGDPYQWRQLFQNLLANAVKYHRSEVKPLIKIYGEETDGMDRVFVEDNGIGFDEKYLDKIFQPFQRLHGRNEYPGTGIGLAICKKIIERHGGTLTARSTPGKGSTFIITLPKGGGF
jgi:PAS domain S-box-containing protein